ncbi:MAG: PAS domain-containing protein [Myxococcota bacterium]
MTGPDSVAEEEIRKLREQVSFLRRERALLLQHMSDGYWDWRIQEDYEYMSPRFWEIFGYRAEEKEHRPSEWQALIHPDDLAPTLATFERHVESRGAVPYDQLVRYRHKEGHWVTVRCRGEVIEWGDDGKPIRMVGTHTDVTTLNETRSRAEILYASASVGIWDWLDVNEDKEFWSPRFYQLLGYEPGEIPATLANFQMLLHPDDHERTFAMVTAHLDGTSRFDLEYRLKHKTKGYRWFRGLGEAVFDDAGKPVRMVGSIQDIHERRVAVGQLEALSVRHELSLKASGIGIWDWDVVNDNLLWDERMFSLYGVRKEDFGAAYDAWVQGVHPGDRDEGARTVEGALAGTEEFNTSFRVVWPSGEVRTIRAIATVVRDDDGKPLRMVGVNWDVTELQRHADEIGRASEELARINTELEQFVYFASHDLQAPIRHVTSFVKLIEERLETQLDGEVKDWMGFVTNGAHRMKLLVEDLLMFSRAGKEELVLESFPLAEVVGPVADVVSVDRDRALRVLHDELPTVQGKASLIRQVMQNLFENAVKYARPEVPPEVRVTVEDAGSRWRIHVKDNGIGIDEKFSERIFQPFQTLARADSDSTGIGLALCKKIVERHGGEILLSESGSEGSTFSFTLGKG